jgi:hypothetical protein
MIAPLLTYELSRRYHLLLAQNDAAMRELEAHPEALTVEQYDETFRTLQAQRARLVEMWQQVTTKGE